MPYINNPLQSLFQKMRGIFGSRSRQDAGGCAERNVLAARGCDLRFVSPPGLPSQPSDAAGTVVVFPVAGGSPTRFPGEQPDGGGPDGPPDSSPGSGGPRKSKAVRGFAALLRRGAGLKARLAREPAGVPHLRATVAAPNERTDRPLWGLGRHRWRIRFSGWIFVARSGRNRKSLPLILRSNPDLGPGVGGQATPDRSKPPQTSCFAATTLPPWTRRGD